VERSPVHHVINIRGSLLLLLGEDDAVVPPAQALAMYEAAQVHNIDAELVIFPAEGHGFRQGATIEQAYTSIIDFLSRCWGLNPSP
jgi:dipeptidyl aminopeptidase/acylaminoacyl peptidase